MFNHATPFSTLDWYFNLITQSEKFIFLDDAQFSKNNWHNRNRILNNNLPLWISVPIKSGNLKKKSMKQKLLVMIVGRKND